MARLLTEPTQEELFDLPPSRPDSEPMTEEQIEEWMKDLPW